MTSHHQIALAQPGLSADDELWTEKRVSEFTTLSVSTLQRMRAQPTLGGPQWFKLGNGRTSRVVYAKSTTMAWVASRHRQSTSDKV